MFDGVFADGFGRLAAFLEEILPWNLDGTPLRTIGIRASPRILAVGERDEFSRGELSVRFHHIRQHVAFRSRQRVEHRALELLARDADPDRADQIVDDVQRDRWHRAAVEAVVPIPDDGAAVLQQVLLVSEVEQLGGLQLRQVPNGRGQERERLSKLRGLKVKNQLGFGGA